MASEALGKPRLITLHWTAGSYTQTFNTYHFCVQGDGNVMNSLSLKLKGSHTWGRNTGNIGIAMCAMRDSQTMPTKKQIEATAALVADLSVQFSIAYTQQQECRRHRVQSGQRIPIPGTMLIFRITDHAAYARCDGYYPDRWDCGQYTEIILKKAAWYRDQIRLGNRKPQVWEV